MSDYARRFMVASVFAVAAMAIGANGEHAERTWPYTLAGVGLTFFLAEHIEKRER
jgi:hypothetical protein